MTIYYITPLHRAELDEQLRQKKTSASHGRRAGPDSLRSSSDSTSLSMGGGGERDEGKEERQRLYRMQLDAQVQAKGVCVCVCGGGRTPEGMCV